MDLRLHFNVLWRHRYLVLGGFVAALVLSFFAYFSVDFNHGFKLSHRQAETWQSSETLLLTQVKSPFFSTNPASASATQDWLTTLPGFYSEIANSDVIAEPIRNNHSLHGTYAASQVYDKSGPSDTPLPFLEFDAVSPTRADAVRLASTVSNTFLRYIASEQASRRIPQSDRVLIHKVTPANLQQATLIQGRRKTLPLIVFLAVVAAAVGLAYILENLRRGESAAVSSVGNLEAHAVPSRASQASDTRRRRV